MTGDYDRTGNTTKARKLQTSIGADLAAVIAAGATAVGSFGIVISGIWVISLALG